MTRDRIRRSSDYLLPRAVNARRIVPYGLGHGRSRGATSSEFISFEADRSTVAGLPHDVTFDDELKVYKIVQMCRPLDECLYLPA